MPADEDDVIALAPVDREQRRREEEMRKETQRLASAVDHERGGLAVEGDAESADSQPDDVQEVVEQFVLAMRDSKLDDADKLAAKLKRSGPTAKEYVDGLMLDPTPPPIGDLPKPVLHGFLKMLLTKLG
jgi:hypothetical protein